MISFCNAKWATLLQSVPLATEPGISLIILTPMKVLQRNFNRSTFVVWEMKRNVSAVHLIVATRSSGPPATQPVSCNHHNSCIYGNLQHFCKSIGRWGTLNRIFPAGWSDIPHFTRQHGRNSVLFQRPRHFEGTLATALARSDAAWLFLMGISEREVYQNKPRTTDALKANHRRNSGSDSGRTGEDFPKYGAPGSILSGRKWWPLPAHVMMPSHFLHNEVSPLQISLQYPH